MLMSTLLCEHLKTNIPDCEVHYMVHEHSQAVVLGNPFVDRLILFKSAFRGNKLLFLKFLLGLRKERFDAIIDVYGKLESNLISLALKSPLKISYKKWYSSFIYDETFKRGQHPKTDLGDALETRLVLLKPILRELKNPTGIPKIYLSKEEIATAKTFLVENGIAADGTFLVIGALGSSNIKSYPKSYMAELLDVIAETQNVKLIFNALPSQKEDVKGLIEKCSAKTRKVILEDIFVSDLRHFLGVLALSKGYFGNEGGAGNMARALGIPNFSIFSPWISKEAWLTQKSNSSNVGVHLADFIPELLEIPKKERKKKALDYYQQLKPELFKPELNSFLEREIFTKQ